MAVHVWAPNARRVELETDGKYAAMAETGGGWWQGQTELPVGTDYAFCLDGGPPRPDPRSHFQPRGIHGPSRIFDHSNFKWDDARWQAPPLPSAVVYERGLRGPR